MDKKKRTRAGQWLSSQRCSSPGVRRLQLGLEPLEERRLLTVTFYSDSGRLYVNTQSGAIADRVAVGVYGDFVAVYDPVSYVNGVPTGTPSASNKVPGGSGPGGYVVPEEVQKIEIETHGGQDLMGVTEVTTANGYLREYLVAISN